MKIVKTVDLMSELASQVRFEGRTIGFVPTMGAFHEGHLSLIRRARSENDYLVVSIFVNPLQFCSGEDFDCYPKDYDTDSAMAEQEDVDIIFLPSSQEFYIDQMTKVMVKGVSEKLCGPFRPGHFEGVATVVLKFFNIVSPHRSYFGEKDYQQFFMLNKMVKDLNLDMEVIGCPTIRAGDGLALSSRHKYLGLGEREQARIIPKCISMAKQMVKEGEKSAVVIEDIVKKEFDRQNILIDYVSICNTETLDRVGGVDGPVRIFVAGRIGKTRLIDNDILEA